jgi:hypothetical protein
MIKLAIILMLSTSSAFAQNNMFGNTDPYYVNNLYKNIDELITHRNKQIYDLPGSPFGCYYAGDPYKHAKDWSNPKLNATQIQDVINAGMQLFDETFSDSLKNNPALKEKLEGKLAGIKSKGCDYEPNKCLVEIYSTIETYARFVKPNLNEERIIKDSSKECGSMPANRQSKKFQNWATCDANILAHNERVQQKLFYLNAYKEIQDIQKIKSIEIGRAAVEYFQNNQEFKRHGGMRVKIAKSENEKLSAAIHSLNLELQDESKKIKKQMDVFWDRLAHRVKPQAGCAISGTRFAAFPLPDDLAMPGISGTGFYSEDNIDDSCYTEQKILLTDFIRTDFDAGVTSLNISEENVLQQKLQEIVKMKQSDGFTITEVQLIGIASRAWSSLPDAEAAKDKNLVLAKAREDVAKKIVQNFTTDKISYTTGHELAGPDYKKSSDLSLINQEANDQNLQKLYNQLIADNGINHLDFVGIKSFEEFKSFVGEANQKAKTNSNDKGVRNIYDAKYRPFQGFKVVIKGHKATQIPCKEFGDKKDNSSKTKSSKAKAE